MAYSSLADLKKRKPFRWWYDAIIDWRLANPEKTEQECARHFTVSPGWLSIIVNSDMFKARWEQRRSEFSATMGESVQRRLLSCLDATLEVVEEQLRVKRTALPFKDTTKFMTDTLSALGYGGQRAGGGVTVNVGAQAGASVTVSADDLAAARQALLRSEESRRLSSVPRLPAIEVLPPEKKELPLANSLDDVA